MPFRHHNLVVGGGLKYFFVQNAFSPPVSYEGSKKSLQIRDDINMTQKKGDENMKCANKEMQEEMVGVLTAISIVSKRLASRLLQLDEEIKKEGESKHEQNETCVGCSK